MNLQGRNLAQGMSGDDVLMLKIELTLLGYKVFEQAPLTHIQKNLPAPDLYTPAVAAAVREVQSGNGISETGVVDETTAQVINAAVEQTSQYAVFGRVFAAGGESLPDVLVELLERDMPSHEVNGPRVLGETETGLTGYIITYNIRQFAQGEANPPQPDLQIRLPQVIGADKKPVSSAIHYNSPRVQIIDVRLDETQSRQANAAQSEFERIQKIIAPVVGDFPPESWSEEDIKFLSGETEISYEQVYFLHLDAVYRQQLPPGVFYGILRQGGGPRLQQILSEKLARNRQHLENSVDANIIPFSIRNNLDEIMAMLESYAVEVLMTASEDEEVRPEIGQVVGTAPIAGELQQRFVSFWLRHQDEDGFWERLIEEGDFDEESVTALQFTLTANNLVGGNLKTLQALQKLKQHEKLRLQRDLARLSPADWAELTGDETEAQEIATRIEHAFPTASVAFHVAPAFNDYELLDFFDANVAFDLRMPIDAQLDESNFDNVQDPKRLRTHLMELQRTMAVAPQQNRLQVMQHLIASDYTSAGKIVRTGKPYFIAKMTPIMGEGVASLTYDNAINRMWITGMTVQQLGDYITLPMGGSIPSVSLAGELPTWAQLFGSLNACACEHCRSMYSPAAYMVDLLQFLRDTPGTPNLLAHFLRQRPDIQYIKLNCDNATIAMPYIDLINEILEMAVIGDAFDSDWKGYQTLKQNGETHEQAERRLRAEPAHEHTDVYDDILKKTVYPWNLPFHPDWERIRLFSKYLDIDLYELHRIFGADETLLARDYLGLSQPVWEVLTRPVNETSDLEAVWGIDPDSDLDNLDELREVPIFLHQSQLTFAELEALEATAFLMSQEQPMTINRETDPCDVDTFELNGLTDELLEQIFRFLRLRQHLGWSIENLDAVLSVLGYTQIIVEATPDAEANASEIIEDVARVARLSAIYRIPVEKLVQARGASVARIMGTTEREASLFATLVGVPPLDSLTGDDVLDLLDKWNDFRKSGFDIRELAYILTGQDQTPPAFTPSAEELEKFLRALHAAIAENEIAQLEAVQAEIEQATIDYAETLAPDLSDEDRLTLLVEYRINELKARLAKLAKNGIVENIARYISLSPEIVTRLLAPTEDGASALLEAQSTRSFADRDPAIEDFLVFTRDLSELPPVEWLRDSWDELLNSADLPKILGFDVLDDARDYMQSVIEAYDNVAALLYRLNRVARLLNKLEIDDRKLNAIENTRSDNNFLDLNQIRMPDDPSDVTVDQLYKQWQQLVEVHQLQHHMPRADLDIFDFIAHSEDTLEKWFTFINEHTGWDIDPVGGDIVNNIRALLEALSLTNPLDLSVFKRISTYQRLHQAIQWLRRYRIDVETLKLWANTDPDRVDEIANNLKKTAYEHRNSDESWYKALTPLMDELREKKRDALLAYLIWNKPEFSSTEDVYAHFFIDPEMGSCMLTSRIKQANASIQLFVQRILMNLETINISARGTTAWRNHWKQWEWMKNYRVWEANRKVFLYPENWIYPELRDNKSPFFIELENALLQDEIKPETIERAYRNYLWKLDEVANLDVRGLYHEYEEEWDWIATPLGPRYRDISFIRDVLHVFARTNSSPHVYYYRNRNQITGVWSAWEKVNLNIEGDHLIPVVHNGRLMLFWATFSEIENNTRLQFEISLSWSERTDRGWIAGRSNKQDGILLEQPILGQFVDTSQYSFRLDEETEQLDILVYKQIHDDTWSGAIKTFSLSTHMFRFDDCSKRLTVAKLEAPRVFLHPNRTQTNNNLIHENDSSGDWMTILQGQVWDDRVTDPTLSFSIRELATSGGLGGLILAIVLAAGETGGLEELHGELQEISRGITNQPQLLRTTAHDKPGYFEIVPSHQTRQFLGDQYFFFRHSEKSYLVSHVESSNGGVINKYRFETFFHPFICNFIQRLNRGGIPSLLAPPNLDPLNRQQMGEHRALSFKSSFQPTAWVTDDQPMENISFELSDAYALYNWELFFHIPLLVATRLSENGYFEEAQRWFHYIFNPTDTSFNPTDTSSHAKLARYWQVKPFFELAQKPPETLADLLRKIAGENVEALKQVEAWRDDPFNPHHIARLRHVAYMKTTVMKYLDNLIDWGDYLYQRDTMESINEAAQLYLLAAELLGPRPVTVAEQNLEPFSYADLIAGGDHIDALSNAWLELENLVPIEIGARLAVTDAAGIPLMPYFCIPENDNLLSYWDTVADRLFKIRNCMNIEGQIRQLPLFEPPIDPALLVRARAAGLDLRNVLDRVSATKIPHYRYAIMYQKALELCNEVRSLGNALLSALEKKDAEELSLLRTRHEGATLAQVRLIKDQQIKESKAALEALLYSWEVVKQRERFYSDRLSSKIIEAEEQQLEMLHSAQGNQNTASDYEFGASLAYTMPDISIPMGPGIPSATAGGSFIARMLTALASRFRYDAGNDSYQANKLSIIGSFRRREEEWSLQLGLAQTELRQLDKQIAAAEIRLAIAEQDLANHNQQIEHNRETEDFLRRKFSNQELYGWMVGQLAALHYQTYKLAAELAQKAERAAQHELGLTAAEFSHIDFGHWDGLRKGLLAGERLHQELRRMDVAYLEQNKRRLEITKHISLSMLDPFALITLREAGECQITIPEVLFDIDFPGHFNRRIKSVSLTIPCVVGPYTSVSATLTLEEDVIRQKANLDNPDIIKHGTPQKSVAISSARNDSGLFELNFRDERFLPFEGFGAVSAWKLELPSPDKFPAFDYDTISDVILHLSYTAIDGGSEIRSAVQDRLTDAVNVWIETDDKPLSRLFSLRHDFPDEWHRFLHSDDQQMTLEITKELFPFFVQGKNRQIKIVGATLLIVPSIELGENVLKFSLSYQANGSDTSAKFEGVSYTDIPNLLGQNVSFDTVLNGSVWHLKREGDNPFNPNAIGNLYLVCHYQVNKDDNHG